MEDLGYGGVLVTKGEHKGKIGYYDDDDYCCETDQSMAIVYFDEPFKGEYYLIPHEFLTQAKSEKLEKFRKENPILCKVMGI